MAPFVLALRPSRWLLAAWGVIVALLLALAWQLPPVAACLPVAGALAAVWSLAGDGWLPGRRRAVALQVDARGRLWLDDGQARLPAQVLPHTWLTQWLGVLALRVDGRERRLALWPDSADADALRRLRVYLRWFDHTRPDPPLEETP